MSVHLKKLSKLVNFCVTILILRMEENMQYFWHIMLYFKQGENTTKTQKICAVYGQGAVTGRSCQRGWRSFVLETSC